MDNRRDNPKNNIRMSVKPTQFSMAFNIDNCTLCDYGDYDGDEENNEYDWYCIRGFRNRKEVVEKAESITQFIVCDSFKRSELGF